MYSRHNEIPVFETRHVTVEAALFNQVTLRLKRFPKGIRLAIPGLKTLEVILQPDAWIVVDKAFNDVPVAAWVDFETAHRDNLHLPIGCHIRLFHANAAIVLDKAQAAIFNIVSTKSKD